MIDHKNNDIQESSGPEILSSKSEQGSELLSATELGESSTDLLIKPSVISEGFEFKGEICANGSLTIEGVVTGKVSVNHLTIGSPGVLDGDVSASTVIAKGRYTGQLKCDDITVGGRSVIDGNLTYSSIVVQRGGILKGTLSKK